MLIASFKCCLGSIINLFGGIVTTKSTVTDQREVITGTQLEKKKRVKQSSKKKKDKALYVTLIEGIADMI
jgi:hypothetical protein